MVGGEEAPQDPDGGLEQVHVLVDVEVEVLRHPVLGLGELLLEVHDQHGVQAVYQSQAKVEPDIQDIVIRQLLLLSFLIVSDTGTLHNDNYCTEGQNC